MSETRGYRLRVTPPDGGRPTYVVRTERGVVTYLSADLQNLALSNLLSSDAAETLFRLEDALDEKRAKTILTEVLGRIWANNKKMQPRVDVL